MQKLLILFVIILLSGCATYQKTLQTKRDNKLYGKVVSNERVYNRVGELYISTKPIIPFEPIYKEGSLVVITDSLPYPSSYIREIQKDCPSLDIDSLKKLLTKTVYKLKTDTLKVADTSVINRYARLYDMTLQKLYTKEGEIIQLKSINDSLKGDNKKLKWWIVGIVSFIVISTGTLLYFAIKGRKIK